MILANEGVQSRAGFDPAAAEEQWVKLRQAQEVSATRVRPLRVNLPTRGVRYAFSQALQTQTGRPLTVRMAVDNDAAPAWGLRICGGVAGFLLIWAATAWALSTATHRRSQSDYLAAS
jgi:hypothetical protein